MSNAKENIRFLPPLLYYSLYDCRIFIKITNLRINKNPRNQNYNIFWKWWGETTNYQCRLLNKKVEYAVASKFLEHYLKLCEVLEFTVWHVPSGDIIGSAFLYNLATVLKNPNPTLQIVDHCGNPIGILTMETDLSDFRKKTEGSKKDLRINDISMVSSKLIQTPRHVKKAAPKGSIHCIDSNKDRPRYGIAASLEKRKAKLGRLLNKEPPAEVPKTSEEMPCEPKEIAVTAHKTPNPPYSFCCFTGRKFEGNVNQRDLETTLYFQDKLPTVMDFLTGKDLSAHEERLALTLLQKISPSQKFVKAVTDYCEVLPCSQNEVYNKIIRKNVNGHELSVNNEFLPSYHTHISTNQSKSTNQCTNKYQTKKFGQTIAHKDTFDAYKKERNSKKCDGINRNKHPEIASEPNSPKKSAYNLADPVERAYFSKFIRNES